MIPRLIRPRLALSFLLFAPTLAPAALVWDGGGDNVSVFSESNWTDNSGVPGTNPPANSVNAEVDVLFDCLIGGNVSAGGSGGAGGHFDLGDGFSLTITDDASWKSNTGTGRGIRGVSGGATEELILTTTDTVETTFLLHLAVSLSRGTLQLTGGSNPLNASRIDFTTGSTGRIHFTSETTGDVTAEHLSKITVNGAAAVTSGGSQNIDLVSDGGAGSTVSLFAPPADTDMDGLEDGWEVANFGNLAQVGTGDPDGDGLDNEGEETRGTDPNDVDSDRDGLADHAEVTTHSTEPTERDTDGDGTPDGLEVAKGLDPIDPSESLDRPNIIFFFVDDLGYGDIGCFWQDQKSGTQKFDTPGIDAMAAEGAKLTHHYISASVCAPSRASLLQGRHQGHCDVRNSQFDKALADNHTISGTLQRAGYRTIHVGKGGLSGGEGSVTLTGTGSQNLGAHPLDRGFDEFFGYLFHADGHEHYPRNGTSDKVAHIYDGYRQVKDASSDLYTTDAWTAYAKNAIKTEAQDGDNQPFFLYLAYDTPHFKMQRPAVAYPAGGGLTGGIQWTTATDGTGKVRYASTANGTGTIDGYNHPANGAWPTSNQQHVGMIRRIDNSIADIIQTLKDLNLDDNTLCIFSSDNGPHNEGNNPRYFESFADMEGIKRDMWEAGIRVPTVVRWPGSIAGATGDEQNIHEIGYPSAVWDWMPTFAEMAQVPAPAWCDGVSLLPTLTGTGAQRDKGYLYFEFNTSGSTPSWSEFGNHGGDTKGQMQCIRIGDHMGVRTGIGSASDNFRIYDVTTDPAQGTNLAGSMSSLQEEMKDLALQARRPGAGVSRPYDADNVPAITTPVESGLEYASYEGLWSYVPEFRDLTPAASGDVTNVDLSVRTRDDDVGLLFTGYVQAPSAGTYTFYLSSDTGANLFIHDGHVIDDDFNHDGSEQSGSIHLEAGLHPIRLYYRHAVGAHALDFSWSGPGIAKAGVPDTALFRAGTPPPEPVALDDAATTTGGFVDIPVLDNDSDDGLPLALSISGIGTPAGGTAVEVSGVIRYTPNTGFYGTDTFPYTITDGQFLASALVTVQVAYNDPNELWMPFNNCEGLTTSSSTGAVSGSLLGFADSSSHWVSGPPTPNGFGMALQCNGSTSHVQLDASYVPPAGASSRTITAWIKASGTGAIVAWGSRTSQMKWHFRLEDGGTGTGALRIEVEGGYKRANTDLRDNQWHHVALVFAGNSVGDCLMYVDGAEDTPYTNGTDQTINTTATPVEIGKDSQSRYFQGVIDELHIYRSALSAVEIAAEMNAGNQDAVAWHQRNFGPAPGDWSADSDNDGLTRLGEYAFGGNPHVPDPAATNPTVFFNAATGKLETTITRRIAGSHSLLYTMEVSNNLLDWTTLTATEIGNNPLSLADCLEKATYETDATSAAEPRQFMRARAEFGP